MDKIHLQTVDQGSAICQKWDKYTGNKIVWDKWQMNQLELKEINISSQVEPMLNDKHWAVQPRPKIHLTSSLFVLHKDVQLQQPPRNIRIIPHHSQGSLKLSLHAKLYTAVSCINVEK